MPNVRPDLFPLTEKSEKIVRAIRDRIDFSYRHISQRFDDWDTAEEHYRLFRPADVEDAESVKKYGVQKIIVPIQFATIQAVLTFMMEVFTALKPVLRVRGPDPATIRPARVMELLLDYDYRGNRGYFMVYQWFLNCFRYGYGVMSNSWGRKTILKRTLAPSGSPKPFELDGQEFSIPPPIEYAKNWLATFEGNIWKLMDVRNWFYDPRVPLSDFQEGEFCGMRTTIHLNDLQKLDDDGIMFNIIKVPEHTVGFGTTRDTDLVSFTSGRDKISPEQALILEVAGAHKRRRYVNEEIVIELSPRDYKLSEETRPENWLFNLIDGTVITRAEPAPFYDYPYRVIECFPDALASMSHGFMELTEPLAGHLNFLFNSHMANVRKAINDMILADPSRINMRDLLDPSAGKVIRLLPHAYGTDPAAAIKQLAVTDVTRSHSTDIDGILALWERITGVSSAMFGQISSGRRTAAELQGVMRMTGARMKMIADLFSSEGIAPLTQGMAVLRQENMSREQFIAIAGRSAEELGIRPEDVINVGADAFASISPSYIQGVFEYPAEEGVMPQDRAMAADILGKMFETIAQAPFLAAVFDPVEVFREQIRQAGIHHVDDFLRKGVRSNVMILEDQRVRELLAAGKIAPYGGGGGGRPDEGVRKDREELGVEGFVHGAGSPRNGT